MMLRPKYRSLPIGLADWRDPWLMELVHDFIKDRENDMEGEDWVDLAAELNCDSPKRARALAIRMGLWEGWKHHKATCIVCRKRWWVSSLYKGPQKCFEHQGVFGPHNILVIDCTSCGARFKVWGRAGRGLRKRLAEIPNYQPRCQTCIRRGLGWKHYKAYS